MGICAGAWGCGSHGNVWENGAGIWGKPRGCVGTADMEGSACAWGPPACMGNGNPVKAGNMKAGCGLQTLRIFGNIRRAAPGYGVASSTEATPANTVVAPYSGDHKFVQNNAAFLLANLSMSKVNLAVL